MHLQKSFKYPHVHFLEEFMVFIIVDIMYYHSTESLLLWENISGIIHQIKKKESEVNSMWSAHTVKEHLNSSILWFLHSSLSLGCWGWQGMCYVDTQTGICVSVAHMAVLFGGQFHTLSMYLQVEGAIFHCELSWKDIIRHRYNSPLLWKTAGEADGASEVLLAKGLSFIPAVLFTIKAVHHGLQHIFPWIIYGWKVDNL